jgi:hypothetical protein
MFYKERAYFLFLKALAMKDNTSNPYLVGTLLKDKVSKAIYVVLDSIRCPFKRSCIDSKSRLIVCDEAIMPCDTWLLRILQVVPGDEYGSETRETLFSERTVQCSKYYEVVNESNKE